MTNLLLGLAVVAGAPALKDKDKSPSIVGEWALESMTINGGIGNTTAVRYTFTADGKWLIHRDGTEVAGPANTTKSFTVDPKADPPTVDLITTRGMGAELRLLGIFKVEGDTLTIVGTRTKGGERPKSFDATGAGITVYKFKRVKKD